MTDLVKGGTERDTGFFGQPRVLANLFGVELWERFSYYGMQGIMLLYLYYSVEEGGLGIAQGTAAGILGAYGGLVYLFTIAGGWVADRLIGAERTLFFSAVIVMAGHIALAVLPGLLGVGVGLVLVALGSGGVKATATSIVGTLYDEHDSRRDAGFSLFYMGINLGALLGPLLTGWLQTDFGFHLGFGAAAVGMAFGLAQYSIGRKKLPPASRLVPHPLPMEGRMKFLIAIIAGLIAVAVLVLTGVINVDNLATVVIIISVAATVIYFVVILSSGLTPIERKRVLAFIPMFLASFAFWSLFQQQSTVVTIYSDQRLDRSIFGWEMPVTWVNSINPVFIIIFAGVFAAVWTKLGDRQPPTPIKFAIGVALVGVSFLLFIPMSGGGPNSAPLLGLAGILLVMTFAELFISPVGLSLSTKLAPKSFQTQMVSLYFLSVACGTAMSGELAEFYNPDSEVPYFGILGAIAIVVGILVAVFTKPIQKLMSGVR